MPHPDHNLFALRLLDELCWREGEATGEAWVSIDAYAEALEATHTHAARLLLRLVNRGLAERKWIADDPDPAADGRRRHLFYGVSDAGGERLLREDTPPRCNCSPALGCDLPTTGDHGAYTTAGCPIHGATP